MVSRHDDLARAALAEVTAAAHVGGWIEDRAREDVPGVVDVVYANTQEGYRGWAWIVSVADPAASGEGDSEASSAATVLELGLLPVDDALLAPEWVPWSVRLAEWQAQQAAEAAESSDAADEDDDVLDDDDNDDDDNDDDDLDDDDDDDDDDLDDDDLLDDDDDIDGVDIDDLDDSAEDPD